ncbi:MAG: hypothetical protein A2X94_03155 [Bdellovibrionales bacterium GWB1_55_8]|nr:MAG: hypothetical protein A2X94_03155 [Bdellovibrionales bacterium GWB1_55_8]
MKLKTVVSLFGFLALLPSFALAAEDAGPPAAASELSEVARNVDEMKNAADAMLDAIHLRIGTEPFPDYEYAVQQFLLRTTAANERIHHTLDTIKNDIETQLSAVYTAIQALEEENARNPSRDITLLIKQQKKSLRDIKAELSRRVSARFQASLAEVYTLGGFLNSSHGHLRKGNIAGCSAALLLVILPGVLCFDAQFENKEYYRTVDLFEKTTDTRASRRHIEALFHDQAMNMFVSHRGGGCQTVGCVYLMAENYKFWLQGVRKALNRNIRLTDGITLEKMKLPRKSKANRVINKLAALAAREL